MKFIHWFHLATLIAGLALLFFGWTAAGGAMLVLAPVIDLVHSALTGKQTNDGSR